MSPLLQISLAIVFLLWVLPITWALATSIGALPRLIAALRALMGNISGAIEPLMLSQEEKLLIERRRRLDVKHLELQDEVIRLRALLAQSNDEKDATEKELERLNIKLQGPEVTISEPTVAEELKAYAPQARLAQLQKKLEELDTKIDLLRVQLREKECEIHKSYTIKLVLIARGKPPAVSSNTTKVLDGTATVAKAKFEMLEKSVETRELRPSGEASQDQVLTEFHEFGETVWHLPIHNLNVSDLKQLAKLISDVCLDIKKSILDREAREEKLNLKIAASESEYEAWIRKMAEGGDADTPHFVTEAEVDQIETKILSGNHKVLLQESKKQTHDLKLLLLGLSKRKEEILIRAAELRFGNMDFSPKE